MCETNLSLSYALYEGMGYEEAVERYGSEPDPCGECYDDIQPTEAEFPLWATPGTRENADFRLYLLSLGFTSPDPDEAGEEWECAYQMVRDTAGVCRVAYPVDPSTD